MDENTIRRLDCAIGTIEKLAQEPMTFLDPLMVLNLLKWIRDERVLQDIETQTRRARSAVDAADRGVKWTLAFSLNISSSGPTAAIATADGPAPSSSPKPAP